MDNQTSQPRTINPDPVQNQAAQPSQLVNQKPPKPFFLNKLFWLVLILILLFAGGGAYLTLNSKPKPEPVVSKTVPTSMPTPATGPTASWQTYTNTRYSYTLKYPKEYKVLSGVEGLPGNEDLTKIETTAVVNIGQPPVYVLQVTAISETKSLENVKNELLVNTNLQISNMSDIIFSGLPALRYDSHGYPYITVLRNNIRYDLTPSLEKDVNYKEITAQILSTFKFTDASQTTDTSTWKTYTNAKGKYSLQYPPTSTFTEDASGNVASSLSNNKVVIATEPTALSLNNYVDQKTWCVSISSTTGKTFNLNSESSLRFDKTPCGITGSTDIYSVHNGIAYHINIETQQNFDTVLPIFDQVLSTFKFTQ